MNNSSTLHCPPRITNEIISLTPTLIEISIKNGGIIRYLLIYYYFCSSKPIYLENSCAKS